MTIIINGQQLFELGAFELGFFFALGCFVWGILEAAGRSAFKATKALFD